MLPSSPPPPSSKRRIVTPKPIATVIRSFAMQKLLDRLKQLARQRRYIPIIHSDGDELEIASLATRVADELVIGGMTLVTAGTASLFDDPAMTSGWSSDRRNLAILSGEIVTPRIYNELMETRRSGARALVMIAFKDKATLKQTVERWPEVGREMFASQLVDYPHFVERQLDYPELSAQLLGQLNEAYDKCLRFDEAGLLELCRIRFSSLSALWRFIHDMVELCLDLDSSRITAGHVQGTRQTTSGLIQPRLLTPSTRHR